MTDSILPGSRFLVRLIPLAVTRTDAELLGVIGYLLNSIARRKPAHREPWRAFLTIPSRRPRYTWPEWIPEDAHGRMRCVDREAASAACRLGETPAMAIVRAGL